jgi:hypothetical protein
MLICGCGLPPLATPGLGAYSGQLGAIPVCGSDAGSEHSEECRSHHQRIESSGTGLLLGSTRQGHVGVSALVRGYLGGIQGSGHGELKVTPHRR